MSSSSQGETRLHEFKINQGCPSVPFRKTPKKIQALHIAPLSSFVSQTFHIPNLRDPDIAFTMFLLLHNLASFLVQYHPYVICSLGHLHGPIAQMLLSYVQRFLVRTQCQIPFAEYHPTCTDLVQCSGAFDVIYA